MMAEKKERFETLLEEINTNVKLVAEGHQVIRSEMKQMKDELVEKIELVDGKVDFVGTEITGMKRDIKDLKFQSNTLNTSINAVHYDVKELDKKVDEHLKVPHII